MARWRARFTPQAWRDDYAIDVDPDGDTDWWVSEEFLTGPVYSPSSGRRTVGDYLAELVAREAGNTQDVLDKDDVFQSDPAAPEWVREWSGPFNIHLTQVPNWTVQMWVNGWGVLADEFDTEQDAQEFLESFSRHRSDGTLGLRVASLDKEG